MLRQHKLILDLILFCFPWFFISTLFAGLIYTAIQQDLRISANDPQIQIAEDSAAVLAQGSSFSQVLPTQRVDIGQSLATYVIVYDSYGKQIASSATLKGQDPVLPYGVFDSVKEFGERRFTWQPQPGVRSAVVITPFSGKLSGFVLAGRSLKEVENRENNLMIQVLTVWALSFIGITTIFFVTYYLKRSKLADV